MIVHTPAEFRAALAAGDFAPVAEPCARAAFLVAPHGFALAAESAQDNRYMQMQQATDALRALGEHAELAAALRRCVPTFVFPGAPDTPDAVFPNNVFATAPGRLIVGAMRHAVRRREAERTDIRAFFTALLGYDEIDLSRQACVAELTGALAIDRARGIGYCGLSERCDMAGARAMHAAFGLRLTFCFALAPGEYHTNVVLAILAGRVALIAPDGFADADAAAAIAAVYAPQVVILDAAQKAAYCGNAIALTPDAVWLSARAAAALSDAQRADLARFGFALRTVALDEIEKAGGSLRCCVGEVF